MGFEYKISQSELGSLVIEISPNSLIKGDYSLLENCLIADIVDDDDALSSIDDVLLGKTLNSHLGGNMTIAEFDKEQTEIVIGITETPKKCTLPTWLFREIVEVWLKEYKKHFEMTHKDIT